jgi:hypothetical protein
MIEVCFALECLGERWELKFLVCQNRLIRSCDYLSSQKSIEDRASALVEFVTRLVKNAEEEGAQAPE